MSADNGIYIAEFDDGFRICHGSAIDNLDFFETEKERQQEIYNYFHDSALFSSKGQALEAAQKLYDDVMEKFYIIEYGIQFLGHFGTFPAT